MSERLKDLHPLTSELLGGFFEFVDAHPEHGELFLQELDREIASRIAKESTNPYQAQVDVLVLLDHTITLVREASALRQFPCLHTKERDRLKRRLEGLTIRNFKTRQENSRELNGYIGRSTDEIMSRLKRLLPAKHKKEKKMDLPVNFETQVVFEVLRSLYEDSKMYCSAVGKYENIHVPDDDVRYLVRTQTDSSLYTERSARVVEFRGDDKKGSLRNDLRDLILQRKSLNPLAMGLPTIDDLYQIYLKVPGVPHLLVTDLINFFEKIIDAMIDIVTYRGSYSESDVRREIECMVRSLRERPKGRTQRQRVGSQKTFS